MFFDSHMHSDFSFDSKMTSLEILEKMKDLNIGVTITDHIDLNLSFIPKINMLDFNNHYKNIRNDNFLIGLEIGLYKENPENLLEFVKNNIDSLDFVLGSIHTIKGNDLYYSVRSDTRAKKEIYQEYLEEMLYCVEKFDFFDSLSHIDYIARYAQFKDTELYLTDFKDLFKKIFSTLITKNKVLELNSNRLKSKKSFDSLVDIYSYYSELGGKYITIGSDAHRKDDIAGNFSLIKDFLVKTNLKAVYFKKRKMFLIE